MPVLIIVNILWNIEMIISIISQECGEYYIKSEERGKNSRLFMAVACRTGKDLREYQSAAISPICSLCM